MLKLGYIEFAMVGNYSTLDIQLLLTPRVNKSSAITQCGGWVKFPGKGVTKV